MPPPSPKENVFSEFSGADTCWKLKHLENVSSIFSQTFSHLNSAFSNSSVFELPLTCWLILSLTQLQIKLVPGSEFQGPKLAGCRKAVSLLENVGKQIFSQPARLIISCVIGFRFYRQTQNPIEKQVFPEFSGAATCWQVTNIGEHFRSQLSQGVVFGNTGFALLLRCSGFVAEVKDSDVFTRRSRTTCGPDA
jgi:hypothetical protein